MQIQIGRRQLLRQATGLAALSSTLPSFLQKTSLAFDGDLRRAINPIPGLKDDRVLVVVQLAGGNDGLNTVVPYGDDAYYRGRPKLAVDAKKILKIDDHIGFHPELAELKGLLDDGALAVAQGVGYPNPDRSHFRSTEIWETAAPADKAWTTGWLGRYFDNDCAQAQSPMLGFQVGDRPTPTFSAKRVRSITLANPAILEWPAQDPFTKGLDEVNRLQPTGIETLDYVQRTANETLGLSKRLREAVRDTSSASLYAPFEFSQSLKLVAQMIAADLPTRVYYVSLSGFDTHAGQSLRHPGLLQELSQGLGAFHRDLKSRGQLDRTLVMTFSEFGRRVAENQSGGTDHGAANVMFLMGGGIIPGMHGASPDLTNLDDSGDIRHTIDFRSIYASVLGDWFGADPTKILEGSFAAANILKPRSIST